MKMLESISPNFDARAAGKRPIYLVLHYTDTETAEEALSLLKGEDPAHKVSAHYFVDTDGTVTRLVDEEKRAWHAGKSYWEGEEDINSCSIGIEIQNPGHSNGYKTFPPAQVAAVKELCKAIIARHGMAACHVLGHSDVAPARKTDPGELFPWEELAHEGIGVWPEKGAKGEGDIEALLTQYGYDPRLDLKTRVTAFQRHFQPEVFRTPGKAGTPDAETLARLRSLLAKKQAQHKI